LDLAVLAMIESEMMRRQEPGSPRQKFTMWSILTGGSADNYLTVDHERQFCAALQAYL
jgi:hypothetical protein